MDIVIKTLIQTVFGTSLFEIDVQYALYRSYFFPRNIRITIIASYFERDCIQELFDINDQV